MKTYEISKEEMDKILEYISNNIVWSLANPILVAWHQNSKAVDKDEESE